MNGTWGYKTCNGGSGYAVEKLGYHANTADLLRGWLDGGIEIRDARIALGYRNCFCGYYGSDHRFVSRCCPVCGKEALPNIEGGE